jgi:hypothetical protein
MDGKMLDHACALGVKPPVLAVPEPKASFLRRGRPYLLLTQANSLCFALNVAQARPVFYTNRKSWLNDVARADAATRRAIENGAANGRES